MMPRWRWGAIVLVVVLASLYGWPGVLITGPIAGVYAWFVIMSHREIEKAKARIK